MASHSVQTIILTVILTMATLISAAAVIPVRDQTTPESHDTTLEGPPCCFASNCWDWGLDASGKILRGTCYNKKDQRGHWDKITSSLDLSHCVGNFNGILKAAEGGAYSRSCGNCTLDGTSLTCDCLTPTRAPGLKATVDLNVFVQDYNGRLRCFDYDATISNSG